VVPGEYRVELSIGSQILATEFSVVKEPRLSTGPEAYRQQFNLLRELTASLGKVHATINNIRRLKNRLAVLAGGLERDADDLGVRAAAAAEQLTAVEAVLVDVHREAPRDVLRNPAGLNDTLVDLINTVSLSDTAPTSQAAAVAKEVMARAEAEIGKFERFAETEIAGINRLALDREIAAATAAAPSD
jgi:ABC-type transporter Mla subunit MlaD